MYKIAFIAFVFLHLFLVFFDKLYAHTLACLLFTMLITFVLVADHTLECLLVTMLIAFVLFL